MEGGTRLEQKLKITVEQKFIHEVYIIFFSQTEEMMH